MTYLLLWQPKHILLYKVDHLSDPLMDSQYLMEMPTRQKLCPAVKHLLCIWMLTNKQTNKREENQKNINKCKRRIMEGWHRQSIHKMTYFSKCKRRGRDRWCRQSTHKMTFGSSSKCHLNLRTLICNVTKPFLTSYTFLFQKLLNFWSTLISMSRSQLHQSADNLKNSPIRQSKAKK